MIHFVKPAKRNRSAGGLSSLYHVSEEESRPSVHFAAAVANGRRRRDLPPWR